MLLWVPLYYCNGIGLVLAAAGVAELAISIILSVLCMPSPFLAYFAYNANPLNDYELRVTIHFKRINDMVCAGFVT